MLPILMVVLAASAPPVVVKGDAAFSHRIESAAEVRGIDLGGASGCALALDCSRIGDEAWVKIGAAWVGPFVVVDCGSARDRGWLRERGRAVDLPWSLWEAWGLPLAPYPVEVAVGGRPPGVLWR